MSETCSETVNHIRTLLGGFDGKSTIYIRRPRKEHCSYGNDSRFHIDIDGIGKEIDLMYLYHQNMAGFNVDIETGIHQPAVVFNREYRQLVFKWLILQIYVNSHLMDSCSAEKRLREINQLEFDNAASILYDGHRYWLSVRIADIASEDDQQQFIRELPAYIAYLSIRWNMLDGSGDIIFMINPEVPLSDSTLPLAGTLNHISDPPCRTKWVVKGSYDSQKKVNSDIRRAWNSFDSMGKTDGLLISDYIDRYISIIKINQSFTVESFWNYSKLYETLRTLLRFPSPSKTQSQRDLFNIITLRAYFLAPPSVVESIMKIYYRNNHDVIEKPPGDFRRYVYRLILKADFFILKQLSTGGINEEISSKIQFFAKSASVLSACLECPSFDALKDAFAAQYGSEIVFPENGLYIIMTQKGLRNFIHYRHPGSKYRYYYITLPSLFLYIAGKQVNKRGILLIRSEIAPSFINEINVLQPEKPIAVYFWFYGRKYKIKQLSPERKGPDFIIDETVLSSLKRESPELFQMDGVRERDRIRRRKYSDNLYIESEIPTFWLNNYDVGDNNKTENGGDEEIDKSHNARTCKITKQ